MKGVTNFFITIIAFTVFTASTVYSQSSVSGTVRFADNSEPVNAGTVQAYDLSCNLLASAQINPDGTYDLPWLPVVQMDILAFPDVGPEDEDFVPTLHPNKTDWQTAVHVTPITPLYDIDIYVERILSGNNPFVATISGKITLENTPVENAIVYAKRDNQYFGFGITDDKGDYEINSLPQGDYILVVHRIGASSATRNVSLTKTGLTNVIFNLEGAPFISKNLIPSEFKLSQNYPNPFNPLTKLSYSVPVQVKVVLSVYNSMGQLVETLVNEVQASGSYNLSFNGSNLSSGVYFYKIEAGSFTETKKMILIK